MTVRAAATPELLALESASGASSPQTTPALFGIVIGGSPNGDVVIISQRALAIVRAGQFVRAFVIAGLESLRRTVVLGANRTLRLENGIYQLV